MKKKENMIDALKVDRDRILSELRNAESRIIDLETSFAESLVQGKRNTDAIAGVQKQLSDLESQSTKDAETIAESEKLLQRGEAAKTISDKAIHDLRAQSEKDATEVTDLKKQIASTGDHIANLDSQIEALTKQVSELTAKNGSEKLNSDKLVSDLEARNGELNDTLKLLNAQIVTHVARMSELDGQLTTANYELGQERESNSIELTNKNDQLGNANARLERWEKWCCFFSCFIQGH